MARQAQVLNGNAGDGFGLAARIYVCRIDKVYACIEGLLPTLHKWIHRVPADCGCSKYVDIQYQLDAHLRTAGGNATPCFLCGSNRSSIAQIEEATALTILNHRTKTAQVVEAVRAKAKTEWQKSITTYYINNFKGFDKTKPFFIKPIIA